MSNDLNLFLEFPRRPNLEADRTSAMAGGAEQAIEAMLLFVVQSLADHPEDVTVRFVSDEDGDAFEILAAQADLGRIIGKNGQTAKALQMIVNANGRRTGRRYHLDIDEIGGGPDVD